MTEKDAEMVDQEQEDDYETKLKFINTIAKPMANKKLTKRLFKCIKKGELLGKFTFKLNKILIKNEFLASAHKNFVRQGLKEVQKFIRRGEKG